MEQNITAVDYSQKKTYRIGKIISTVLLSIILIAHFVLTIYLFHENKELQQNFSTLNDEMSGIKNDYVSYTTYKNGTANIIERLNVAELSLSDEAAQIERLRTAPIIKAVCLTDNFVISEIYFDYIGSIHIDVYPQPKFLANYKGEGKFSCTDRELKGELQQIDEYVNNIRDSMLLNQPFETSELITHYTIKGYELATSASGDLLLRGE